LTIVSVIGPYGSGKSALLNKFLKEKFGIGPRFQSAVRYLDPNGTTQGFQAILISTDHEDENGPHQHALVIDTEGRTISSPLPSLKFPCRSLFVGKGFGSLLPVPCHASNCNFRYYHRQH
jgi:GTPase SAR1 family protein